MSRVKKKNVRNPIVAKSSMGSYLAANQNLEYKTSSVGVQSAQVRKRAACRRVQKDNNRSFNSLTHDPSKP